MKRHSYVLDEKVRLNSKYINTKQNTKLKAKFLSPFQVFNLVGKHIYKPQLPIIQKIHDVFQVSLLNQNTTRKGQVNQFPELKPVFHTRKDKKC